MNKSHITNEQVDAFCKIIWPYWPNKITDSTHSLVRKALESAFPDTSTGIPVDPKPAAFGKLVVSEEMDHDFYRSTLCVSRQAALQSFVDRHSIKPIAFADRLPEKGQGILIWDKVNSFWCACIYNTEKTFSYHSFSHWLPASALPVPEPVAVDAKGKAYEKFLNGFTGISSRAQFDFVWESAQRAGKQNENH
jgi:hypothetical protein